MTDKEIEATLTARGVTVARWEVEFRIGNRRLETDEVMAMLPGATEDEVAAYAESKAKALRQQLYNQRG